MAIDGLQEVRIDCPYCGEAIDTVLDLSAGGQEYIEDCAVCCRPMRIRYALDHDGRLAACHADRDDD
ncbi:MAG TPA: CPXCG motif-containing cysteine-rich protein [Thioalkalivibrio sp.]|nr:CPXCG motif-containing cysteine-rich protein [Thioalkalivibrio sp.]